MFLCWCTCYSLVGVFIFGFISQHSCQLRCCFSSAVAFHIFHNSHEQCTSRSTLQFLFCHTHWRESGSQYTVYHKHIWHAGQRLKALTSNLPVSGRLTIPPGSQTKSCLSCFIMSVGEQTVTVPLSPHIPV